MVNASLANPTRTGKCVCSKYYWAGYGLSQQFSTAALPSNVTFFNDDKLTSQIVVLLVCLWPNGLARSRR